MREQEQESIFKVGEPASEEYFTGNVKAATLLADEEHFQVSIFNVIFEKGARTNWHSHPSGQILLVVNGEGLYQLLGEPVQKMKPGDVVVFPPGIDHWHGAAAQSSMTHIAINPNTEKGLVDWKNRVTDEEYLNKLK